MPYVSISVLAMGYCIFLFHICIYIYIMYIYIYTYIVIYAVCIHIYLYSYIYIYIYVYCIYNMMYMYVHVYMYTLFIQVMDISTLFLLGRGRGGIMHHIRYRASQCPPTAESSNACGSSNVSSRCSSRKLHSLSLFT